MVRSGFHHQRAPPSMQISRRQMRELSVHKRRIYRRLRTGGLCCHVPAWPSHPSALTMRFAVRALQAAPGQRPGPSPGMNSPQDCSCPGSASHLLRCGFLRTMPRGLALAFGSWLSLLTMSPSRYSHRGLAPQKFAPMLGAHPSLKRSANGRPPGPGPRYGVHFLSPGPGVLPLAPP